jgi:hypothetical protein
LSRAFEQTLTVDALHDKIDDAESALRPWPSINFIEARRASSAAPIYQGA